MISTDRVLFPAQTALCSRASSRARECRDASAQPPVAQARSIRPLWLCLQGTVVTEEGWRFPPFIVVERGESLDEWQAHVKPDFATVVQVRTANQHSCCAHSCGVGAYACVHALKFPTAVSCAARSRESAHAGEGQERSSPLEPAAAASGEGSVIASLHHIAEVAARGEQVLSHICERVKTLHDAGVAHRDLKPGNVLWRPKHYSWTLIDFGCAAEIGAPQLPTPPSMDASLVHAVARLLAPEAPHPPAAQRAAERRFR